MKPEKITIDQIKADIKSGKCKRIYSSSGSLWWTHLDADVEEATKIGIVAMNDMFEAVLNDPSVDEERKDYLTTIRAKMNVSHELHPDAVGVPTDPTGAPLFQYDDPTLFIAESEKAIETGFFGSGGLNAFLQTHHSNRGEMFKTWEQVNDYLVADRESKIVGVITPNAYQFEQWKTVRRAMIDEKMTYVMIRRIEDTAGKRFASIERGFKSEKVPAEVYAAALLRTVVKSIDQ